MDKQVFVETLLYNELKDNLKINTKDKMIYYIQDKYDNKYYINYSDLYAKINNYRIKKYGTSIFFFDKKVTAPYQVKENKYGVKKKGR